MMTQFLRHRYEQGAALLSVLLLVAVMSVAAVAMLEISMRSIQTAKIADGQARVNWLVAGAEQAGLVAAEDLWAASEGRLSADTPGLGQPNVQLLEGAELSTFLEDATNCFNLNAVASGEARDDQNAPGYTLYEEMLTALGLLENDAETLAASLADWIDADNTPRLGGAEDGYYVSQKPPYRAASRPLVAVSDLRAVRGYTKEVYEALLPLVCVRDDTATAALNINTLTVLQAPLLAMAFSGELDLEDARDVIRQRPIGGWPSVDVFLEAPALEEIGLDQRRTDLLAIQSSHIRLRGQISQFNQSTSFQTLYTRQANQPVEIIRRTYGAF